MASSDLSFRFAGETDFNFIWAGELAIAKAENFKIPDVAGNKSRLNSAINGKKIILASVKKKSAGFIRFTVSNVTPFGVNYGPFDRTYAYVDFVYVHPNFRKRGVGTGLYTELEHHCEQKGIPELICDVYDINKASEKFHKTLGFKRFVGIYSKKLD